jgi:hypothetical protein
MDIAEALSRLPLWGFALLVLALCVGCEKLGGAWGRAAAQGGNAEPESSLGSHVGALLGLLAFTLAFTFSLAADRFNARKQLVLDESNAIGTTYLRASLLPPPTNLEVRGLLREYTALRVGVTRANVGEVARRSEEIHGELWRKVEQVSREPMDPPIRALFIDATNQLIDLHQSRKTVGLQYRIPGTVWLILLLLTAISMLVVGYQGGGAGRRPLRGAPVLAVAFALMLVLIADLDRANEGMLRVSMQALVDLQASMAADSP